MSFQRAPWPPMTAALAAASAEAVQVLTPDGRRLEAGEAVLYVLEALGHGGLAAFGRRWPMRGGLAWGYRLVARHRGWFSSWLRP